ncbi:MAG: redoxin domain-containing protein [Lewinellaceae bacterium]|nr:redoxin domain-containing protein [Phaeodactylibacter sp.]MCB9036862.1 redoxin domain-containing protein [Lewinellaceae bacterium]
MQVSGSLDNELLYKNLQFEATMQPRFQAVGQKMQGLPPDSPEYQKAKEEQEALLAQRKAHLKEIFDNNPQALFTKFKTAGQNPEVRNILKPNGDTDTTAQVYFYRTEFWDNVDFSDERLLHTPVIFNKLKRYMTELTPQHPDSINQAASFLVDKVLNYPEYYKFFANWITIQYEPTKTSLMDSEAVFVHMIQNYFTYDRAFWSDSAEVYSLQLRANEMAGSLVGHKGPDVQAQGPDGKMHAISDIKAPYVVVYMFNPDCEHCQEQSPKLVQFYKEWKSKGVEVFGIGVDTNKEDWSAYLKKVGMNAWPNVFDPTNKAIYGKYFVDITPEIYVLNPDRTIIAKNLKVHQIAEVIERDMGRRQ